MSENTDHAKLTDGKGTCYQDYRPHAKKEDHSRNPDKSVPTTDWLKVTVTLDPNETSTEQYNSNRAKNGLNPIGTPIDKSKSSTGTMTTQNTTPDGQRKIKLYPKGEAPKGEKTVPAILRPVESKTQPENPNQ